MKRILTAFLIMLLLLTGCSRPQIIDPARYTDHPFDLSLLSYMGSPSDQVTRCLKREKIEWEERQEEQFGYEILRGVNLTEPITMEGDRYQCSLTWYPPPGGLYCISFSRSLDHLDVEEYRAEIRELYELMKGVAEAAGKSDVSHTLKAWILDEKNVQESGYYSACWILEEDIRNLTFARNETLECELWVKVTENTVTVCVDYELDPGPMPL